MSQVELDRARSTGDVAAEVDALSMLARVAILQNDLAAASNLADDALSVARRADGRELERAPIHILAALARMSGDLDSARALYGQSIALSESFGLTDAVVAELHNLGYIELHAGNVQRAGELFDTVRRQVLERDMVALLPYVALDSAVMANAQGDPRRAVELLADAEKMQRERGEVLDPDDAAEQETLRSQLVTALGRAEFDRHYASRSGEEPRG